MNSDSPILVTGGGGFIGSHIVRNLESQGKSVLSTLGEGAMRVLINLEEKGHAADLIRRSKPSAVLHAAAISSLQVCEENPDLANRVNREATEEMALAAAEVGARFAFFSTDQVFCGGLAPYSEASPTAPIHVYGKTKAGAEEAVLKVDGNFVVLRPSLVYGASPSGERSASEWLTIALERGETPSLFVDEFRLPVAVEYVAQAAILAALDSKISGVLHLGGADRCSRYDFGRQVAEIANLDPNLIRASKSEEVSGLLPRPKDLTLSSEETEKKLQLSPVPNSIALRVQAKA